MLDDIQLIWDNCKLYNQQGCVILNLLSGSMISPINYRNHSRKWSKHSCPSSIYLVPLQKQSRLQNPNNKINKLGIRIKLDSLIGSKCLDLKKSELWSQKLRKCALEHSRKSNMKNFRFLSIFSILQHSKRFQQSWTPYKSLKMQLRSGKSFNDNDNMWLLIKISWTSKLMTKQWETWLTNSQASHCLQT